MLERSFDFAVKFERRANDWFPIVRTLFIRNDGYQFRLPLLLDTGSDILVLHRRFERMFGNIRVSSRDSAMKNTRAAK